MGIWRSFGCAAVLAVAGSHACLVLGARRRTDGALVSGLVLASLALGLLDALGAIVPIAGIVDEVDEGLGKLLAATLVLLVLTSVLPPILCRLQASPRPATPARSEPAGEALAFLTGEVEAIADRIEELNRGPGVRAPEIRREVNRLRDLARSFQR